MFIAYTENNKNFAASLAPGVTPEQAATAMNLAPGSWRVIDAEEAAELQKPSPEEQRAAMLQAFTDAIQEYLDAFARTRNYDGIMSAATYATSTIPRFRLEGQYAVEIRDATWAAAYGILEQVLAGRRPMPTPKDVIAELPAPAWPQG